MVFTPIRLDASDRYHGTVLRQTMIIKFEVEVQIISLWVCPMWREEANLLARGGNVRDVTISPAASISSLAVKTRASECETNH
jgi:hypothetical protein